MSRASTHQLWIVVHRYLGLTTLGFLFIAAVTGCFLCFDKAIDAKLNPDLFSASSVGVQIDPIDAVTKFEARHPGIEVVSFPLRTAVGHTIELGVTSRNSASPLGFDQAFLDPHDGHLVGTRKLEPGWGRRHLVEGVFQFHYTLLAGTWGRWIMGLAALGWLVGNVVGFYLTLPLTKPFWRRWKRMWKIDGRAKLRRFMLDLHRASGLWLFIGVVVLAFTSVCMNFFDEAFTPAVEAISPARESPFDQPEPEILSKQPIGFSKALKEANAAALADGVQWKPAKLSYIGSRDLYGLMFTPSGVENYRWLGPITYYVSGADGHLEYIDSPYSDSAGRKLSRSLYPLHSGEVIGPIGVAIIFLLGLATAEMCVSGVYTWWKKRQSRLETNRLRQSSAGSS
ncbi:PepSY-associated TM helix domain-containing protein [Tsuneonella mangrovi]|uniref:PepSY-associated TM helix domain-containing protein n=1 Tax=Tsuneonella mangrovi TaxID=1982042 RepID=UPI000BA278A7|nr:PepSY-associated TM helix domain-containing protein [Tsuneonella mangrovi]